MKKVQRYKEGGETESVYERAKRFLQAQGVTDATPALDEKIKTARKTPPAPPRARQEPSLAAQRVMEEGRRLAARDYHGIEEPWGISGFKAGGKVSSASRRADGIAQRGKTRGKVL